MDYMDVYTPYSMAFMAVTASCVIISALLLGFFTIKVRKGLLFWSSLWIQASLLVWLCGKILELIAPVQEILLIQLKIQKVGVLFLVPSLLMFCIALKTRSTNRKLPQYAIVIGASVLVCAAGVIFVVPRMIFDYSPICALLIWSVFIFHQRRNIFAELSDISIDAFMDRTEDAIVIFDRSGKMMDCNENAKCLFPVISIDCDNSIFYDDLNLRIISGSKSVEERQMQAEIGLACGDGQRFFLYSETLLKNKKNMPTATIITFHDVTERNILLNELGEKNTQLKKINDRLKDYIAVSHRLEDEKEKNRAILEIQQTLGQRITELLLGLEALKATEGSSQDDMVKIKLYEIIDNCRTVMSEIRKSVENLTAEIGADV